MAEPSNSCRDRIESACALLEGRLADDVPLAEVADAASYSAFHFHRLFRGITGETVGEYVRRLRLERAAHRLTQTDEDILGIALQVGYGSHEAFTRAFARQFGVSPSEFRTEQREVKRDSIPGDAEPLAVRIESREPCRVAFVRHVGPYDEVAEAWKTLMKWGWSKCIFGKPEMFGLCHDDPDVTVPENVRYDACLTVSAKARPGRGVEIKDFPGGRFAVALHAGPYGSMGTTYAGLFSRVAQEAVGGRHWTLGDPPAVEKYLNDPRKTKQEDLRTEVWMPVS